MGVAVVGVAVVGVAVVGVAVVGVAVGVIGVAVLGVARRPMATNAVVWLGGQQRGGRMGAAGGWPPSPPRLPSPVLPSAVATKGKGGQGHGRGVPAAASLGGYATATGSLRYDGRSPG